LSFCGENSLVNHSPELSLAVTLFCNSWSCEQCNERRQTKLIAQALSGRPTLFLTLTANPMFGDSPADRLKALAKSWRLFVQNYRRHAPNKPLEYLVTVEETKAGEPHLHILIRGRFIPQAVISQWMSDHMDSPIVFIERIKNARKAARYVAKYVAKKPAQFDRSKRYWQSTAYVIPDAEAEATKQTLTGKWFVVFQTLAMLSYRWEMNGATIVFETDNRLEARAPPYEREYQTA